MPHSSTVAQPTLAISLPNNAIPLGRACEICTNTITWTYIKTI
jgi:hypothetical protein